MPSLRQIVKKAEEIAENHQQLNSFYFGHPFEIGASSAVSYALMGLHVNPGSISKGVHLEKLSFYFADLVNKDEGNETEVLSDLRRVAMGVFGQFRDWCQLNKIVLVRDAELSPFWENWDDEVCGWQMDVTIQQFYDANACQEPSTFVASAEDYGSVRIFNLDTGATIDTVPAGGEYGVLEFSGIIDNGPPYSNSIVDNG